MMLFKRGFFVGASEVKFVGSDITVNDAFYKTVPGSISTVI
jgi:hypothetical protein